MFDLSAKKIWRINLPASQLKASGVRGADEFRDRFIEDGKGFELEPDTGFKLDKLNVKRGDRFILTGVSEVGGGGKANVGHSAIATGIIEDFRYSAVTKRAKVEFKNLSKLLGPPHDRAMPKPHRNGNVHEVDTAEWKKFERR